LKARIRRSATVKKWFTIFKVTLRERSRRGSISQKHNFLKRQHPQTGQVTPFHLTPKDPLEAYNILSKKVDELRSSKNLQQQIQ